MACGTEGACVGGSALYRACVIGLVAVLAGAVDSGLRPVVADVDSGKLRTTVLPAPPGAGADAPGAGTSGSEGEVLGLEITCEQGKLLYDVGTPFLDARHDWEFVEGHVARAVRVASDEFMPRAQEVMALAPPPGPVVIYCGGGTCDASHNLAALMQGVGYTQIHIMKDGFPRWQELYPADVAKGTP